MTPRQRRKLLPAVATTLTQDESTVLGRCIAAARAGEKIDGPDLDAATAVRVRMMTELGTLPEFEQLPVDQKESWYRLMNKPGA